MTRRPETIEFWTGRLPHWEVVDGRYFVTIHLAGAIPKQGQERIRRISDELRAVQTTNENVRLQLHRKIFQELEGWLDRAERKMYLRDERVARMVIDAIEHRRHGGVWNIFEYVVMPTHVHLFFELVSGSLKEVLESFKQWTGREAGKIIGLDGGRFWQKVWFDHWSRSDEEDERIATYIRHNPVKAGLVANYADWPFGSWRVFSAVRDCGRGLVWHQRSPGGPAGPAGPTP